MLPVLYHTAERQEPPKRAASPVHSEKTSSRPLPPGNTGRFRLPDCSGTPKSMKIWDTVFYSPPLPPLFTEVTAQRTAPPSPRRRRKRRLPAPPPGKVMNSYSQKIVYIYSAHRADRRFLRNLCRERTNLFITRCITVNNSVRKCSRRPPPCAKRRSGTVFFLPRRPMRPAHTRPARAAYAARPAASLPRKTSAAARAEMVPRPPAGALLPIKKFK